MRFSNRVEVLPQFFEPIYLLLEDEETHRLLVFGVFLVLIEKAMRQVAVEQRREGVVLFRHPVDRVTPFEIISIESHGFHRFLGIIASNLLSHC